MNCTVVPLAMEGVAGVMATLDSVAALTVKLVLPEIAPRVAVTVAVPTAAAETTPRASVAVRHLREPSIIVVGSDDRIVPAASTAVMFRRAPSPTLLATITGGSHCGFMEIVPTGCDAGWISYERQLQLTREQVRRWLARHLRRTKAARVTGVPGVRYVGG